MNHQELIHHLHSMQQDHVPPAEFLRSHKEAVVSRAVSAYHTPARSSFFAFIRSFFHLHITPHALPVAGGIAMVLLITAGIGVVSLRATPQHRLWYQIGSTMQGVNIALHPEGKRQSLEVALLARGADDLTAVRGQSYSPAAVETVVEVVEGRFARVAGHLQNISDGAPEYPFVLLVDTANSADVTEKALSELKQSAPTSLQPKLAVALSTVAKAKRAALGVMVTFKAQDLEMKRIVKETIRKELASVQESVGSLLTSDADQTRVNAAGDVLVQAERELHEGNYQVTLSLINEAENMVRQDLTAQQNGLVEGESIEASNNEFSTSTPPVYETTTDVMIGDAYEIQEESGNPDSEASTTIMGSAHQKSAPIEEKPKEPEEFPVGFDL